MDRREVGTLPSLDDVRSEIVNRVLLERRRNLVKQFVESLRLDADVEIYNKNLMRSESVNP